MVNKVLFANPMTASAKGVQLVNTVNEAGGVAYKLSDKEALAQLLVTGCFNNTFYVGGAEQLDNILSLAKKVDVEFAGKAAVYARQYAKMKDAPVILLASLTTRGAAGLEVVKKIFPKVINNTKSLRNFFQVIRSNKVGRRNFGTALRNLMADWLNSKTSDYLFNGSIGNDPTLADVIKLSHVKPMDVVRENFHNYLLGRKYNVSTLPQRIRNFESFKRGEYDGVPYVPFQMLTALNLTKAHWQEIVKTMTWDATRQNLNTLARHGVFEDQNLIKLVAERLGNAENVAKFSVFPYQLMTSLEYTQDIPKVIQDALQDALDYSIDNIPDFNRKVAVCVDVSGSMRNCPVTGSKPGSTTKVTALHVAALVGAAVLRKNKHSMVIPFSDNAMPNDAVLNARDSVWTNAKKLAGVRSGGTNCASAMVYINQCGFRPDLVIYVSDNESWHNSGRYYGRGTGLMNEFNNLVKVNHQAKLVCIDIQPNTTSQANTQANVLNCGGFNDTVFDVINNWCNLSGENFVDYINNKVQL